MSSISKTDQTDKAICYYHQRYGTSTRECRPPYIWILFLVDTGATEISVIPTNTSIDKQPSFFLKAANGSFIHAYERVQLKLYIKDTVFPWTYIYQSKSISNTPWAVFSSCF
uniref:Uncharacterized protein n=1 Tax=Lepeophtheirus salmonis TaxID=72036 RepID=A0A0K2U5V8_LEPSM